MRRFLAAILLVTAVAPAWAEAPMEDTEREQIVHDIQKKVADVWQVPEGFSVHDLEVAVGVKVDELGNVTDAGITKSSGDKFFDASLLRAVRKASPLPVPADRFSDFERMELFFDGQMN